jgi:hypothetical protein
LKTSLRTETLVGIQKQSAFRHTWRTFLTMNLKYAWYVIKHKWFVYEEGRKAELNVSKWQLIIHDWSKFLPSEWLPYAEFFYGRYRTVLGTPHIWDKRAFERAWAAHLRRQPHHWQFWVLHADTGKVSALPMPQKYIREMVADWRGAARAQGKTLPEEHRLWYLERREHIVLHKDTREEVEVLLGVLEHE